MNLHPLQAHQKRPLLTLAGLLVACLPLTAAPLAAPQGEPVAPAAQEAVPTTAARAKQLAEALRKRIAELKQAEEKKPDLLALVERQLRATDKLAQTLAGQEGLEAALAKASDDKQKFAEVLAGLRGRGFERVAYWEVTDEKAKELDAALDKLRREQRKAADLRSAERKQLDQLPASLAALEKELVAAAEAVTKARAGMAAATDPHAGEELRALELEQAAVQASVNLLKSRREKGWFDKHLDALEEQVKLYSATIARETMRLRDLRSRLGAREKEDLQNLQELDAALAEKEKPLEGPLKNYWTLRREVLSRRMTALRSTGRSRVWKDKLDSGTLGEATAEAKALADEFENDEDGGRSLENLRDLETKARDTLDTVAEELDQIAKDSQANKTARRKVRARRARFGAELDSAEDAATKVALAKDLISEEADPGQWENLREELEAALTQERSALRAEKTQLEQARVHLRDLEKLLESNLVALQQRILWTQGKSYISLASLSTAFRDLRKIDSGVMDLVGVWGEEVTDFYTDEERRTEAITGTALAVGLVILLLVGLRFMPRTFSWIEDQERGPKGRASRVLASVLRRTGVALLVFVVVVGVPWIMGAAPRSLPTLAIVFATPFAWRFLRVLLDVVFAPKAPEERLLRVDDALAALLHRAGRWLANLSLGFIPLGMLLEQGGYGDQNAGFVEAWWLAYRILVLLVLLFSVFRPGVILRFVSTQNALARSAVGLFILAYPVVTLGLLAIFVLFSLNYDVAAETFSLAALKSLGSLLVAWFVYRLALRSVLAGREINRAVSREDFESDKEYVAAGRARCFDRLIRLGLRLVFFIPALVLSHGYWPELTWEFLGAGLFSASGLTAGDLLSAVLALAITIVLHNHLRALMTFVVMPSSGLDSGVQYTLNTLVAYSVLAIGFIVSLQILRVDGGQIAVVTGALAVGIGFGLQSIVKNLVSGIILLIERPVKVGDRVEVGDKSGRVEKITIRATTVVTWDGVGVVIPNEQLVTGTLVNQSLGSPRLRNDVPVGVAYGSDVKQVKELMVEATKGHGQVLKRPPPEVFFVGFGDSSLDFLVRFWTSMTTHRTRVASDVRQAIGAQFARNDIEIPFPQRDLNLRNVDPAVIAGARGEELPEPDAVPDDVPEDPAAERPEPAGRTDGKGR